MLLRHDACLCSMHDCHLPGEGWAPLAGLINLSRIQVSNHSRVSSQPAAPSCKVLCYVLQQIMCAEHLVLASTSRSDVFSSMQPAEQAAMYTFTWSDDTACSLFSWACCLCLLVQLAGCP